MRKIGALIILFLVPGTARAADATTTMGVSATVLNACLVSATNMAFGNYDPTSSVPTDATSSISVTCTPGTSFNVGLNSGATGGATVTTRQMLNGASPLDYSLYTNAGRSANWGNTPGSDTVAQTASGITPMSFTVYGRIPAQQSAVSGSYTDTVTVTVSY
ncbi:spore coat U domain-containing protein [Sphingobium sp. JS3065]|jgi:spore coat protein U-like protein|uniref:Csu type fimbrial protein n=1 Tax=Sphingobium sp. JS3065 TaxID=2970925 RepID=UPI002263C8BD|nr:spore coat U domain-containing protein [Sphingobium sp. JS3065]UZW53838.1 spore coat U domain-containing protein [Sphingobium sp. JS3065]